MDAITLLKNDHKQVEQLFRSYESLGEDRAAAKAKEKLVARITKELSLHSAAEEKIIYPMARKKFAKHGTADGRMAEDEILEALEEHRIMKMMLAELEHMSPGDERYDAKMHVLMTNVRHHVDEEERRLFPDIRAAYSRQEIVDMGELINRAKKVAASRPQTWTADLEAGNVVAGVSMLDRAREREKKGAGRVGNGSPRAHGKTAAKPAPRQAAPKVRKAVARVPPKRGRANGEHVPR